MSTEKVQITVAGVQALLAEGLDRKAIKVKLGISHSDMQKLFRAPGLANSKPKKESGFILIGEDGQPVVIPAAQKRTRRTKEEMAEANANTAPVEAITPVVEEVTAPIAVATEDSASW